LPSTLPAPHSGAAQGLPRQVHRWNRTPLPKRPARLRRSAEALADQAQFSELLEKLRHKEWVVYAKPPFGDPAHVLRYLGRYTHRIAISNHRLLDFDGEKVSFRYKDYAHGGKQRIMTVHASEFLRRFFEHGTKCDKVKLGKSKTTSNNYQERVPWNNISLDSKATLSAWYRQAKLWTGKLAFRQPNVSTKTWAISLSSNC
jgi:hypothetical protein